MTVASLWIGRWSRGDERTAVRQYELLVQQCQCWLMQRVAGYFVR